MYRRLSDHYYRSMVALLLLADAAAAQDRRDVKTQVATTTVARRVADTGPYMGLHGSSVSPYGRYLAYTDWTTGDLALFDLVDNRHRRVTDKGPLRKVLEFAESFVRFSADGDRLAYVWDRNGYELWTSNVDGSARRFVYRNEPGRGEVQVFDWSPDGEHVAAVVPKPRSGGGDTLQIALIRLKDAAVRPLKALEPSHNVRAIAFSPDGRFLAYEVFPDSAPRSSDILGLSLDGAANITITTDAGGNRLLGWTPDGGGIFFASHRNGTGAAWFQPVAAGAAHGPPQLILSHLPGDIRPLGFTRAGDFYYATSTAGGNDVFTASVDGDGDVVSHRAVSAGTGTRGNEAPDWSPDGTQLAYVHGENTIVIRSVETGAVRSFAPRGMQRIFTVASGDRYARWSPDGRMLLAPQNRTLFLIDIETEMAKPAVTDRRSRFGRWSPDGRAIFYSRQRGANDSPFEIVRWRLRSDTREVLYASPLPGDNVGSLELSPDGRWLALSDVVFDALEQELPVLRLVSVAGDSSRVLLTALPEEHLKVVGWTPDGSEILFTRYDKLSGDPGTAVWRVPLVGGEPDALDMGARVLTHIRFHRDGRRLAFDSGRRGAEIWVIDNFRSRP